MPAMPAMPVLTDVLARIATAPKTIRWVWLLTTSQAGRQSVVLAVHHQD